MKVWKWYFIDEGGDVTGSDDPKVQDQQARIGNSMCIDTTTGQALRYDPKLEKFAFVEVDKQELYEETADDGERLPDSFNPGEEL